MQWIEEMTEDDIDEELVANVVDLLKVVSFLSSILKVQLRMRSICAATPHPRKHKH